MSESDILKQCLRGDPRAWDRLFDEHYAATGRFVFQLGADFTAEDVEEICQETFLSVVKNLGSFKGGSRLQTWIFRIAANKARDYRQKQLAAKRGGGHTPLSLDAEIRRPVAPLTCPATMLTRRKPCSNRKTPCSLDARWSSSIRLAAR